MKIRSGKIDVFNRVTLATIRIAYKIIDLTGLFLCFLGLFVAFAALPMLILLRLVGLQSRFFYVRFVDDPEPLKNDVKKETDALAQKALKEGSNIDKAHSRTMTESIGNTEYVSHPYDD